MIRLRILLVVVLLGLVGLVGGTVTMGFADAGFDRVDPEGGAATTEVDGRAYVDARRRTTCEVARPDGSTDDVEVGSRGTRDGIGLSGAYVDGPATVTCDRSLTVGRDPGRLVAIADRPWVLLVPGVMLFGGLFLFSRVLRTQRRDAPPPPQAWTLPPPG